MQTAEASSTTSSLAVVPERAGSEATRRRLHAGFATATAAISAGTLGPQTGPAVARTLAGQAADSHVVGHAEWQSDRRQYRLRTGG
jgi:hypothetical protein